MISCCIFDLDGTLLNTLPTIKYYLNQTLMAEGLREVSDDECRRYVGDGARVLLERALRDRGITEPEMVEALLQRYMKAYDSAPLYLTEPYEGIFELLDRLAADGIRLGVVSNKPHNATVAVVRSFFGDRFDAVRGAIEGVPLKPDPTAPLELLGELGGIPEQAAFVGDTAVDILTAKGMGASLGVGVLWGFRDKAELDDAGANLTVKDTDELYSALVSK